MEIFKVRVRKPKELKKLLKAKKNMVGKKERMEVKQDIISLMKAIPTVVRIKVPVPSEKREIPADVVNYVKSVETAFEIINKAVKDLVDVRGIESCLDFVKPYVEFKSSFQWRLNDAINYPQTDTDYPKEVGGSVSPKSRIEVGKI